MEGKKWKSENLYLLKLYEVLISDHIKDFLKERLYDLNKKGYKNLALNESFVEEACEYVLNSRRVSAHLIMKKLNCSESEAKEIKETIDNLHNGYYQTVERK